MTESEMILRLGILRVDRRLLIAKSLQQDRDVLYYAKLMIEIAEIEEEINELEKQLNI